MTWHQVRATTGCTLSFLKNVLEIYLIYNIVLISAVQQTDHVIHTYIYSLSYSFPLWFITGCWVSFPVLYSRSLLFIRPIYMHYLIWPSQSYYGKYFLPIMCGWGAYNKPILFHWGRFWIQPQSLWPFSPSSAPAHAITLFFSWPKAFFSSSSNCTALFLYCSLCLVLWLAQCLNSKLDYGCFECRVTAESSLEQTHLNRLGPASYTQQEFTLLILSTNSVFMEGPLCPG